MWIVWSESSGLLKELISLRFKLSVTLFDCGLRVEVALYLFVSLIVALDSFVVISWTSCSHVKMYWSYPMWRGRISFRRHGVSLGLRLSPAEMARAQRLLQRMFSPHPPTFWFSFPWLAVANDILLSLKFTIQIPHSHSFLGLLLFHNSLKDMLESNQLLREGEYLI